MGILRPTSVETGCLPCFTTTLEINRSVTNMFCSFHMPVPRISLLSGAIETHIQM